MSQKGRAYRQSLFIYFLTDFEVSQALRCRESVATVLTYLVFETPILPQSPHYPQGIPPAQQMQF